MKNFVRKLHLWASIPFGLVISTTCLTGAILVFEKEITALCDGGVEYVEPSGEPLPLDVLVEKVQPGLEAGAEVTGVVISSSPDKAYLFNLSEPAGASVYVDQYAGEVKGNKERLPFFRHVSRLHRWLFDSNPGDGTLFPGRLIVGISTIAFLVILVSGIVVWWPRNRAMLKNRLKIALGKGKRRFWYDLHVVGGIYALLFLLVMALTGLTWSFEWYRNGFYGVFGAETGRASKTVTALETERTAPEPVCIGDCSKCKLDVCIYAAPQVNEGAQPDASADNGGASSAVWNSDAVSGATTVAGVPYIADEELPDVSDAVSGATTVDASSGATTVAASVANASSVAVWQLALDAVKSMAPEYSQMTLSDGAITVLHDGIGNQRASDRYIYNKDTGEIISVELYENSDRGNKLRGWVFSLHVGSWGGVVTRILAFLSALLGATLPLTGYYLWIRRIRGRKRRPD